MRTVHASYRRLIACCVAALSGGVIVALVNSVRAAGIPDTGDVLTYTGHLEAPDGTPVDQKKNIAVQLFAQEVDGNSVCSSPSKPTDVDAGRFQVPLPAECVRRVQESADLWVEVSVDGAPLGRTKLGAVPYAVEASHSTTADSAVVANALGGLSEAQVQKRVSGACAAGQCIRAIAADGTVTCDSSPIVTDWQIYAPVVTNLLPSQHVSTGVWRRVGDSLQLRIHTTVKGTVVSSGAWYWSLPSGLVADGAKLTGGATTLGHAAILLPTQGGQLLVADVSHNSQGLLVQVGAGNWWVGNGQTYTDGSTFDIEATVAIKGWTSTK
ncbi:MAG: hypothetical protein ACOY0T_37580 [Myxococcota bacterium]